jgi:hypothetical protein
MEYDYFTVDGDRICLFDNNMPLPIEVVNVDELLKQSGYKHRDKKVR